MREPSNPSRCICTAIIARLFLPLVLLFNGLAFLLAYSNSASLELVVTMGSIATLLLAWLLQRWIPLRVVWNQPHADTKADFLSLAVLLGLADPLLKALGAAATLWFAAHASPWSTLFPTDLHFVAQVLLALGFIELGKYVAHRMHHALPALWWLHAMHHSPQRFSALNNFRFHPLNYAINFVMSVLPMLLIGIPADVMWAYLAITQPVLMIQHANLDLKNPWLDRVLATPRSHLWHHDADATSGQLNFGSSLLIWDHVFGTYRLSMLAQPERIGLYAGSNYPAQASYLDQLFSVFKPGCCALGGRA
jgi:ornithine lipid hydroxylase